jgi:hypothetical protein
MDWIQLALEALSHKRLLLYKRKADMGHSVFRSQANEVNVTKIRCTLSLEMAECWAEDGAGRFESCSERAYCLNCVGTGLAMASMLMLFKNRNIPQGLISDDYLLRLFCNNVSIIFFFNSHSGGWSPTVSIRHGGHWLAYCSLPPVIMMMENLVEWRLAGETEVLGETPPSATLSTTNATWPDPGLSPGHQWEASD